MKRITIILLKLTGVLLLLGFVLIALLQTPKGKEMVAAMLSQAASRSDDIDVKIGRIRGWIPVDMRVDRIEVSDAQGTWLVMEDLRGEWRIGKLLRGSIRISELGASEIHWTRFPKVSRKSVQRERKPARWRGAPLVLDGWSVDRLKLGADLTGMPLQYSVSSGGIMLSEGRVSGDIAISGDAVGEVQFESANHPVAGPRVILRAELKQMKNPSLGMDRISGALKATLAEDEIDAFIKADLSKDNTSGQLSTHLTYGAGRLQLKDSAFKSDLYNASGDIGMTFSNKLVLVDADIVVTDAQKHRYTALGDAAINAAGDNWWVQLSGLQVVAWDMVRLDVVGRMDASQVNMDARVTDFNLADLPYSSASKITGRAGGSLIITGSPARPDISASLNISDFTTTTEALNELPSLDFKVGLEVEDGHLFASTSLSNYYSGYLVADASLPCRISLMPPQWSVDPQQVDGSLDAVLDLGVFNGLAMLNNQYLNGFLTAELKLTNSVPSGSVYVEEGSYEHYAAGVLLRDIEVELEVESDGFMVRKATATDGASGRLKLSGRMADGRLDTTLQLSEASIIRRPEIEALLSGKLDLSGPVYHPEVAGTLTVDRADLLPDNFVSVTPPLLENYKRGIDTNTVSIVSEGDSALPIDLDIRLELPDQIYVTASLIDSVWGGALDIKGTDTGLWLKGRMEPRRGYVNFIGKKFSLIDGALEVDTAVQPIPVMNNLTTEYSRSDLTVRIVLNGSVQEPQYHLESVPAMPEDEILSQILFKRDAGSITPYQAVQIAMAARQLSGGLSGPGFMYQFRRAIGVDTLEWRESDTQDGSSSVAAGKYVTPEFYVEINSTLDSANETDMTAEYEISRHFSVETSAGPELRPGIGLNWRNDY